MADDEQIQKLREEVSKTKRKAEKARQAAESKARKDDPSKATTAEIIKGEY